MSFEFAPTGGVIPFYSLSSIRLLKYNEQGDYIMQGAEMVFIIFIVYYIIGQKPIKLEYSGSKRKTSQILV